MSAAFILMRLIAHTRDLSDSVVLTVLLESDLCWHRVSRVEQILIPDTQTSSCCSVLQHSGALACPKKHTGHNVVFVPEWCNTVGQRRGGPAFKNGSTTLRTCVGFFSCSRNYSDAMAS